MTLISNVVYMALKTELTKSESCHLFLLIKKRDELIKNYKTIIFHISYWQQKVGPTLIMKHSCKAKYFHEDVYKINI